MKYILSGLVLLLLGLILFSPYQLKFTLAQEDEEEASSGYIAPSPDRPPVGALPTDTGIYQATSLINTVSLVIRWALGFIGIVVFVIFLYAGFEYATAGGDSTKTDSARNRMINAIIGLIIIFFTFVASNTILGFVFDQPQPEEEEGRLRVIIPRA